MIGKNTGDSRLVSISEVQEILEDRQKDGELGYEQTLAFDYAKKFNKLSKSEANKMKKELEEMGLNERLALKMVEIMPIDASQLKLILAMDKTRAPTEDETVAKLMEVVKKYSK
jgi:DNA-directed RNA polymerase subunit F